MDVENNEQTENSGNKLRGYKVFLRIMKQFKRKDLYIVSLILSIVNGILPNIVYIFVGNITNDVTTSNDFMSAVKKSILKFALFQVAFTLVWLMKDLTIAISSPRFIADLREQLYQKLMMIDISYHDKHQAGNLLDRITTDCMTLSTIYIEEFLVMSNDALQTIAGLVLAFIVSWRITLVSLIVFPICVAAFFICEYFIGKLWEEYNSATNTASTKAEEVLASFRTVKSFDNEMKEAEKYKSSLSDVMKVVNKTSMIAGIKDGAVSGVIFIMIGISLYFCVWIIYKKPEWGMDGGDITIIVMCLNYSTWGVYRLLVLFEYFRKANESGRKILEILEAPINVDINEGEKRDGPLKGKVEFKNVSFKYQNKDNYAVKNLSFSVSPGETVALVGESGCGKSTTLQLLQRFYEIEEGEILIDDTNIKTFSPKYLRSQISVVPQTPVLFSMSIKDNIKYCNPSADDSIISVSSKSANAHNFIMSLPDNYDTIVKQTSLSGGQKQRICIARAILANSPILLLDEATAALDTESERLVQESLESIRKGKTAIIVAHRLSTVINSDRIYVFKEGKIVETGTHEELLKQCGYYSELIKAQLQE